MFHSANNKTFGARAREVLATNSLMLFSMLLVVSFFKIIGLASVDFSNIPLLGVSTNFLLHWQHLTLNQVLASPFAVMGVLIVIFGAPFVEEIAFRWFVCYSCASDANGNILPKGKGLGIVLLGSFILFGLAHGNGYFSLMVQGVGGLFLARLWFLNGPNYRASYFSCVAAHSLYNISVVIITWLWAS